MKKILVLGGGCAKCATLYRNADEAAKTLGIEYEIEKITDFKKIMEYGVMSTPALVVDEAVKTSGKVPSVKECETLLKQE
jgi:small redox-active disulfide protein 2